MRAAQAAAMLDTGVVQTWAEGAADGYGQTGDTWTDGAAIACGVEIVGMNESRRSDYQLEVGDAVIRVPVTTTVDRRDRIKITKRNGTTLGTAEVFEVVGQRRGPSATRLYARRIRL
jgi:hypothetical protein